MVTSSWIASASSSVPRVDNQVLVQTLSCTQRRGLCRASPSTLFGPRLTLCVSFLAERAAHHAVVGSNFLVILLRSFILCLCRKLSRVLFTMGNNVEYWRWAFVSLHILDLTLPCNNFTLCSKKLSGIEIMSISHSFHLWMSFIREGVDCGLHDIRDLHIHSSSHVADSDTRSSRLWPCAPSETGLAGEHREIEEIQ
ncbi:hypothetical protein BDV96DRAFT_311971 [Lophiotrema nucula]|uniref:Uncharacterized protein n=1 Tax=Lophiotrema nucula TaxID=690887 RepID=A0A6A5ZLT0_9PLEO|nr:hypothetical protein BDV96DRAFT_311971 [Lophiotrema nucula]